MFAPNGARNVSVITSVDRIRSRVLKSRSRLLAAPACQQRLLPCIHHAATGTPPLQLALDSLRLLPIHGIQIARERSPAYPVQDPKALLSLSLSYTLLSDLAA